MNLASQFKNMDAKIELKRYGCAVIAAVIFAANIKTFVKAGGLYPGGFIAKVASPVDAHVFEQNERVHAVSEQIIPAHALSLDDQQRADALTAVLGGLVDRGIARFATGEIELNDETYAAWLAELKAAGSDELAALYGALPQIPAGS